MEKMKLIFIDIFIFLLSWSSAESSYNIDDSVLHSINFNSLNTNGMVYQKIPEYLPNVITQVHIRRAGPIKISGFKISKK